VRRCKLEIGRTKCDTNVRKTQDLRKRRKKYWAERTQRAEGISNSEQGISNVEQGISNSEQGISNDEGWIPAWAGMTRYTEGGLSAEVGPCSAIESRTRQVGGVSSGTSHLEPQR